MIPLPTTSGQASFDVLDIAKGVEFTLGARPQQLTYEVYFYGTDVALMKHQVVAPPEFDHLLIAKVQSQGPSLFCQVEMFISRIFSENSEKSQNLQRCRLSY